MPSEIPLTTELASNDVNCRSALGLRSAALHDEADFAVTGSGNTPAGKVLAVGTTGDDSTGTRGRLDKPYLTLANARAAASSGDVIEVYPGGYSVVAGLGADGRNWDLLPGATLTATSTTGGNVAVFGDGGAAIAYTVAGLGALVGAGTVANNSSNGGVVLTTTAGSDVRVECRSVSLTSGFDTGSGVYAAVNCMAGNLTVRAGRVANTNGNGWAVWWGSEGQGGVTDGGDLHVNAGTITSSSFGTVGAYASGSAAGNAYVEADNILNSLSNGIAVSHNSTAVEAKVWVTATLISSPLYAVYNGSGNSGKTYVTAQKIVGATTDFSNVAGVVYSAGGTLWVTAQKITGTYESAVLVAAGTVRVTCQHVEDLGHMYQAIKVTGGTLEMFGGTAVLAAGDGLRHSGGTTVLHNVTLDTTAAASKNPVVVSAAGLVLDNCTLLAHAGRDCITASSPQTVTVYGTLTLNGGTISPNITLVGGTVSPDLTTPGTLTVKNIVVTGTGGANTITGAKFVGDGSELLNLPPPNPAITTNWTAVQVFGGGSRGRVVTDTRSLTGDVTLNADRSGVYLFLDPNGADRVVTAWASPANGDSIVGETVGGANSVTLKNDGGTTLAVTTAGGVFAFIYVTTLARWVDMSTAVSGLPPGVFSPAAFGTWDPTGTVECSAALIGAIAAAAVLGGIVYTGPGRFKVNGPIGVPTNVRIMGAGVNVTFLRSNNAQPMLRVLVTQDDPIPFGYDAICDLTLDGRNLSGTPTGTVGLTLQRVCFFSISRVHFQYFTTKDVDLKGSLIGSFNQCGFFRTATGVAGASHDNGSLVMPPNEIAFNGCIWNYCSSWAVDWNGGAKVSLTGDGRIGLELNGTAGDDSTGVLRYLNAAPNGEGFAFLLDHVWAERNAGIAFLYLGDPGADDTYSAVRNTLVRYNTGSDLKHGLYVVGTGSHTNHVVTDTTKIGETGLRDVYLTGGKAYWHAGPGVELSGNSVIASGTVYAFGRPAPVSLYFLQDNLTDTAATGLASHPPDVVGGAWVRHPQYASGVLQVSATGDHVRLGVASTWSLFYNDATPASADCQMTVNMVCPSLPPTANMFVTIRVRQDPAVDTGYNAVAVIGTGSCTIQLYKIVAGTATQLGSDYTSFTPVQGVVWNLGVSAVGTTIKALVNLSPVITQTDGAIAGPGKAAVGLYAGSSDVGDAVGVHLDNVVGWNL